MPAQNQIIQPTTTSMNTNISPILKVFSFSAALTLAIKYVGPSLSIASSDFNALIAVFTPSIILAAILGWRAWQQQPR